MLLGHECSGGVDYLVRWFLLDWHFMFHSSGHVEILLTSDGWISHHLIPMHLVAGCVHPILWETKLIYCCLVHVSVKKLSQFLDQQIQCVCLACKLFFCDWTRLSLPSLLSIFILYPRVTINWTYAHIVLYQAQDWVVQKMGQHALSCVMYTWPWSLLTSISVIIGTSCSNENWHKVLVTDMPSFFVLRLRVISGSNVGLKFILLLFTTYKWDTWWENKAFYCEIGTHSNSVCDISHDMTNCNRCALEYVKMR